MLLKSNRFFYTHKFSSNLCLVTVLRFNKCSFHKCRHIFRKILLKTTTTIIRVINCVIIISIIINIVSVIIIIVSVIIIISVIVNISVIVVYIIIITIGVFTSSIIGTLIMISINRFKFKYIWQYTWYFL